MLDLLELKENQLAFINGVMLRKYAYKEYDEVSWNDIVQRNICAITGSEGYNKLFEKSERFFNDKYDKQAFKGLITYLLSSKKIMFAGSILSGLGAPIRTSLSNCYVVPILADSLEGVFTFVKEIAKTYAYRGGVGTDATILRPEGTRINNSGETSPGPLVFLPIFSYVTNMIKQKDRRGACLVLLDYRHPDILKFVKCKSHTAEIYKDLGIRTDTVDLSGMNISVKVSNELFEAFDKDEEIELIFPDFEQNMDIYNREWNGDLNLWLDKGYPVKVYGKIKARELVNAIASSAHACGDPGVVYWDNVMENSTTAFVPDGVPIAMNPCGEQVLAPYMNCLLTAIPLHKYVDNPWTSNSEFDFEKFQRSVEVLTILSDLFIDLNEHPLAVQNDIDRYFRKIGIGITGLADALAMLGLEYGSVEALKFTSDIARLLTETSFLTSCRLAYILGPAPVLSPDNRKKFIKQPFIRKIIEDIFSNDLLNRGSFIFSDEFNFNTKQNLIDFILTHGVRNTAYTTCQPAGSISIICDNCTSGIEPLFMVSYKRHSQFCGEGNLIVHYPLLEYLIKNDIKVSSVSELETIAKNLNYITSHEISYTSRIKTQAAIQEWVSDSISSTINLPSTSKVEDIVDIYYQGYKSGLKGVTIFRNSSGKGVLESVSNPSSDSSVSLFKAPEEIKSRRYIESWNGVKFYITVSESDDGRPVEVFANLPKAAGINANGIFDEDMFLKRYSDKEAICRLVSLALRAGVPLDEVVKQLDKSSFSMFDLPGIIKRILSKYLDDKQVVTKYVCPNCNSPLHLSSGCFICMDCGYSRCD